jgi:lipoprotein-anchoring transpeptidase ErfK/SrfK
MKRYQMLGMVMALLCVAGCGQGGAPKLLSSPADELYKQAQALVAEGKTLEARTAYQQIISEHPDFKNIEQAEQELYALNMKLLFSNAQTPVTTVHEVAVGDSLGKLSRQYNVTMDMIRIPNGITNDVVRVGQKLRIWTGKFSVRVSKGQNVLMLKSNEDILKVYSVSTGVNNSTPVGTFKIVNKIVDPPWYKETGAVIPPESPENALGSRWLGFDLKGYGIHGTLAPDKIGQQVTSGCVRMRNADVEELYSILPQGTEVIISD